MHGEARRPRVRVLADGDAVGGVMAAEVSANNHLAADRFRVQIAASSLAGGPDGLDAQGVRFDVQVRLGEGWSSLMIGEADRVGFDPIRGVVELEGRDLSALLIDARADETFANRTSSEIVATLAGRHGLDVSATATTTLVGRYYQADHERLTMGQFSKATSEWDLLSYLAVREGFDLAMDGTVLRFEAAGQGQETVLRPGDCVSLELEHLLGMERAIEVTVRSWDQRGAQAVAQTARGGGKGRAWRHSVVRPNMPPDEAQRMAERVLADLVRHTRTVRASMPGELSLTARSRVRLEGTGTGWDGGYVVSELRREVDVRHGFLQRVCLQRAG